MLTFSPIVGVAEIGEVHRLRAGAEHRLLQLDEVADLRALRRHRASGGGARTARRARRRDRGVRDHAVVEHRDAVADLRVDDPRAAVNLAAGADRRPPSSETPGWMMVSAPIATSRSMYVVAGSSMVTPAAISSAVLCCLTMRLDFRQLGAAVDAPNFVGVRRPSPSRRPGRARGRWRRGPAGSTPAARSRPRCPDRVEQPVERERVDPRINLADLALGRGGVLLLDNTCNLLAGPDDPAVPAERRPSPSAPWRRRLRGVRSTSVFRAFRSQERHVAREQDHVPVAPSRASRSSAARGRSRVVAPGPRT